MYGSSQQNRILSVQASSCRVSVRQFAAKERGLTLHGRGNRLSIVESQIGGDVHRLSGLTSGQWSAIVSEGLSCLNESKGYRGRTKKNVTHISDGRITEKWVTPHLTIRTEVTPNGSTTERLQKCFDILKPAYDWVLQRSKN